MMERIWDLFGVGSATLVDDTGDMQRIQVTERASGRGIGDRIMDRVRRVTEFGFTSVPPLDSEVLVARRAGERSQSMVIGTSHRASRPRGLKPGDSALYDVRGATVQLTADGLLIDCAGLPAVVCNATTIRLEASGTVTIDAPSSRVTGNMQVDGELDVTGKIAGGGLISAGGDVEARAGAVSLDGLRDAYAAHKHGGVKSGSDASGGTDHAV
jgi:phage baseplate assembly protein V